MSAGKGDAPRNIFTPEFRENYDAIEWDQAAIRAEQRAERRQHKHRRYRIKPRNTEPSGT